VDVPADSGSLASKDGNPLLLIQRTEIEQWFILEADIGQSESCD